jgi:hypothetical protein
MNMLDEEQYERIARWLDGQKLELTAAELAAAEDIRQTEAQVGPALKAPMPPAAVRRARQRMIAAMAQPPLRLWRVAAFAAASAAAAVLLATLVWRQAPPPTPPGPTAQVASADRALLAAMEAVAEDDEIDLVEQNLNEVAANIAVAAAPPRTDSQIERMEKDVEELYLDYILVELSS